MKLDKETFVKHGFWFALGAFALLWLIGMIVLKFSAGSAVAKEREVYTNSLKGITDVKNPKNESFLTAWNKYAAAYEKEKDKVWEKAFLNQNPPDRPDLCVMTWPSGALADKHKYPDDPFTIRELDDYKVTVYPNQFAALETEFKPVFGPKGPVVLAGGLETMVPRVPWAKTPTPEEVWLAQEDFWVHRELLRTVRGALEAVGHFERVGNPEKLADGKVQFHFKNKLWDVNLLLERSEAGGIRVSGQSTIKNIHPARRTMALGNAAAGAAGLGLLLHSKPITPSNPGFTFLVPGDPVAFGETREFKQPSNRIDSVNFNKLEDIGLEQAFDVTTSPVKQVNLIAAPYNSHRTAKWPLKQWELFKPKEEEGQDASGSGGADTRMVPGGPGGPGSGDAPGGPGMMAMMGAGSKDVTLHGLVRNRYLTANPYVRCMPVALVMIVDQSQLQDVEAAILNSRLRIQITQESWVRVHNFRPGSDASSPLAGGIGVPPVGPGMGMNPGKFRPGMGPSMGAAGPAAGGPGAGVPRPPITGGGDTRGGMRPGGVTSDLPGPGRGMVPGAGPPGMIGPPTEGEGVQEDDPNLVELTVYGIASVYERYPANPNKKKEEEPAK
jgi:hypothetical protein